MMTLRRVLFMRVELRRRNSTSEIRRPMTVVRPGRQVSDVLVECATSDLSDFRRPVLRDRTGEHAAEIWSPQSSMTDGGRREEDAERHQRQLQSARAPRRARARSAARRVRGAAGDRDRRSRGTRPRRSSRRGTRWRWRVRAERRADERHERHVAHAHRLLLERDLAEPADDGDQARAGARADERVVRAGEERESPRNGASERAGEHHIRPVT